MTRHDIELITVDGVPAGGDGHTVTGELEVFTARTGAALVNSASTTSQPTP